ncbi:MAG: PTS mannitol transporter subunit IIA [Microbacteriaceae bacterium]|nr:MAG: PTS mannitol transporter subunit IIA [Microbacteriaceae bacterium]
MTGILSESSVVAAGSATTREEAIREAGQLLVDAGAVRPDYLDAMLAREATVSTYMGNYLAIPHGTNDAKDSIVRSALSLVRYQDPIDWGGEEVRFAVGIAGLNNEHLDILSKIAIVFSDEDDVARLIDAPDAAALYRQLAEVNAE